MYGFCSVLLSKENEEGVATMCKVMEDMRNESAKKADEQRLITDIKNVMESFGVSVEKAMESLKIPETLWGMYAGLVGKKPQ